MRRTTCLSITLVLALLFIQPGCGDAGSNTAGGPSVNAGAVDEHALPVTLVVEFEAGPRTFADIPWSSGMSVLDVMSAAQDDGGKLAFEYSRRGETALLTSIEGVENQGAGLDAKNWLYWVDDTFATRSFAVEQVQPGQTVTWRFAPYDEAGQ